MENGIANKRPQSDRSLRSRRLRLALYEKKNPMEKSKSLVAALFTILGIVIGAGVNHYFASQREVNSDLFAARLNAYVEFMDGQGMRARASTDEERDAANLQIMKSKFTLAMLSGQKVLKSMVDFWRKDPKSGANQVCADSDLRIMDTSIYQEIRNEMIVAGDPHVDVDVLVPFLWNCTVSDK